MRIALAQIDPTVGAVDANARMIGAWIARAREAGADLVVFPELCISGYPPRDLLLREGFVQACARACKAIGEGQSAGITVVLGTPLPVEGGVSNSLLVYRDGQLLDYYDKRLLPTYDVFDEDRYFEAGDRAVVVEIAGRRVGLAICEDLWKGEDAGFSDRYVRAGDPVVELVEAGAELILSASASPFVLGKGRRHRELLWRHATRHGVAVASVNQVGGNDELVFDGHACVYDAGGELIAAGPGFREDLVLAEPFDSTPRRVDPRVEASGEALTFEALRLGVADYCRKTGFSRAVVAVSGGIDSAVVGAIAASALGPERVTGLAMPSSYSSSHSVEDAKELCARLGVRMLTAPIERAMAGMREVVDPLLAALGEAQLGESLPDLAEENLQARIRGMVVMAHSNRTGDLVLTTGNKSELAVGYCTLYGDMNGGLAVLSDVLKTRVWGLARWMNEHHERCGYAQPPIPQRTIDKPPSAELRPGQTDQDSLPPYDVLDAIVERIVERRQGCARIAEETGIDAEIVAKVSRMIDLAEYKRKQLATGLKITGVAFGSGRRMPIAQGWSCPAGGSPPAEDVVDRPRA